MRAVVLSAVAIGALLGAGLATSPVWSQAAPRTCTEAYLACTAKKNLAKACEDEKQWCMKTGTFADPQSKATTSNLRKR